MTIESPIKVINGKTYRRTVGGVYRLDTTINKEKPMTTNKTNGLSNNDKQVIAAGIIKGLKEQYPTYKSKDIAGIASTLYTMARKAANESKD